MPTVSGRIVFDINRNVNIGGNVVGINNIPVALQNTATLDGLVVLTNVNGDYSFLNVPAGDYRIVEAYGLTGGVPTPGDFSLAATLAAPAAHTPPISAAPSVPQGATNIDCVTPNTLLITVAAADILNQYIFNGPVAYAPLSVNIDPCAVISPLNLVTDADNGTFGSFTAGTVANTGPALNPYPDVFPDFTYVVPDPSQYTPIDGEFTIQNIMNNAMSNVIGAWWRIADHTTGNETGRMMIVNEDDPGDIIFRTTITVNPNTTYLFSTWILNLFRVQGYPGPELAVRILDEEGNPLYDAPLGFEIPANETFPVWKEIGSAIQSGDNHALTIEFFSQGEAAIGNDFAIDDITLRELQLPNFTLTKSEDRSTAAVGDTVTYTIMMSNACVQPLENAVFRDYLPQGLAFVPGSVMVNGTPNPAANPLVGFLVPDITGGTDLILSFDATVTAIPTPNPAVNQAQLQYVYTPVPGGIQDMYQLLSNPVSLLVTAPEAGADLAVTKTTANAIARSGDTVTYTVTITNNGPDAAENTVLTDILPGTLKNPMFSLDNGLTWQPWHGSYAVGDLANGGSFSLQIRATVETFCPAAAITNTARAQSQTPDPNPDNNQAAVCIQIRNCLPCRCHCQSCPRPVAKGPQAESPIIVCSSRENW